MPWSKLGLVHRHGIVIALINTEKRLLEEGAIKIAFFNGQSPCLNHIHGNLVQHPGSRTWHPATGLTKRGTSRSASCARHRGSCHGLGPKWVILL